MLLHYVVIHKITEKEVIVADPGKGIVKYTPEEFFKLWTGILILLVPSPKFKKGDETKSIFSRFFWIVASSKKACYKHIFNIINIHNIRNTGVILFQIYDG